MSKMTFAFSRRALLVNAEESLGPQCKCENSCSKFLRKRAKKRFYSILNFLNSICCTREVMNVSKWWKRMKDKKTKKKTITL